MHDEFRIAQISEWETHGLLVRTATLVCRAGSGDYGNVAEVAFSCLRAAVRAGATSTGYSVVACADRVSVRFDASWSRYGAPRHA